jgi:hypothetical protein
MNSENKNVKIEASNNSHRKKLIILFVLLLVTLGIFIIFRSSQEDDLIPFIAGNLLPDSRHADEIAELAQQVADESRFRMMVNTRIEFETPTSHGDIGIVNPAQNIFPIAVDFILDETEEIIFASGAIWPNEFISQAPLDVSLPNGVYEATALFNVYDPETHEHVWEGHVALTILIGQ